MQDLCPTLSKRLFLGKHGSSPSTPDVRAKSKSSLPRSLVLQEIPKDRFHVLQSIPASHQKTDPWEEIGHSHSRREAKDSGNPSIRATRQAARDLRSAQGRGWQVLSRYWTYASLVTIGMDHAAWTPSPHIERIKDRSSDILYSCFSRSRSGRPLEP